MSQEIKPAPLNRVRTRPSLDSLLKAMELDIKMDFNCHAIATIQSFNPGDGTHAPTVTATFNYKKTFYKSTNPNDQNISNFQPVLFDYPVMIDCPIYVLQGGGFYLTFPIQPGDTCSILFNDRDLDNWMTTGQVTSPNTNRLHSISDGIALVGVNSHAKPIVGYDQSRAVLSKEATKLGISSDKILAINAAGKSLNDVLQDLISALQSLTTTNAVVGSPCALSPASIAQLSTIASEIGDLLE